ncbi:peroxiredoxin [Cohnella suwonensis]|uniref:thioredoxin-dependent peroxiredoxin n=1 Tax=Cohnella suwonensis TaxID=696072 RepID=A0ABW0LYC9_9BACL
MAPSEQTKESQKLMPSNTSKPPKPSKQNKPSNTSNISKPPKPSKPSKQTKQTKTSDPSHHPEHPDNSPQPAIHPPLEVGKPVPDFELPATNGNGGVVRLGDYRGRKVVLYFYPKDSTPACTQESCDFRDASVAFGSENAAILGISANDLKSHDKFAKKYELPFPLLADTEHRVCELYGVWQEKQLYGRKYMGIVRSTFLIDENGLLAKEWRNLKVKGHVEEVRQALAGNA